MSEPLIDRVRRFRNTTGAFSWGGRHAGLHPDACVCNLEPDAYPGTPHTHYDDGAPYSCARCSCTEYRPWLVLDFEIPGLLRGVTDEVWGAKMADIEDNAGGFPGGGSLPRRQKAKP